MAALFSQAQQQWVSAGDYCQSTYEWLYDDVFGSNDWSLVVLGSLIIGNVTFCFYCMLFTIVDLTNWPKWVADLRIQKNRTFTMSQFWDAMKLVQFNCWVVGYITIELYYRVVKWRGDAFISRTIPSLGQVVFDLLQAALVYELIFYYLHRAMHHRYVYKYIHKGHHEWTSPISWIAFYVHPLEHFSVNFFASLGAAMIFQHHIVSVWAMTFVGFWASVTSHAGYHIPIPGAISSEAHELHHTAFNYNYAPLGLLDRFHGTDRLWLEREKYQKHYFFVTAGGAAGNSPSDKEKTNTSESAERKRQ